ncbi:MAG: ABC transporter ATP-binding protein [Azospirillaceae bacterium]
MSISAPDSARAGGAAAPLLEVSRLSAFYGEVSALHDVSLEIFPGEVVSVIGANGAGKTTLLKSIVGLMNQGRAAHIRGEIEFRGRRLDRMSTEEIVDAGVTMVPEGRRLFTSLSVEDNLLAGAHLPRARAGIRDRLEQVYGLFPRLAERREQRAAQMSGGEQQMVAIGRALMSDPSLILFDELSLGLAPAVVDDIYRRVQQIIDRGVTCVVIEQDMKRALAVAARVYVMLEGRVVLHGAPAELTEARVTAAYFGTEIGQHGS